MSTAKIMKEMYKIFINDETLLRLLHYIPKNQLDLPLDPNKPNILELPVEKRFEIINNVIYFTDKKLELDVGESKFGRINFYLDDRVPEKVYSKGARKLINNPEVSKQNINVDVHVNMQINSIDFRLYDIVDRINRLLLNVSVGEFTDLKFDYSYSISKTAQGFIGYRNIYYVKSPQSPTCD